MSAGHLGILTDYLRLSASSLGAMPDAELLRRYLDRRDEEPFAILVHRHGPMVLGVCRRALGDSTEADDAFQAVFLALARDAGRIRECLPGWLYRVAVRTAHRALRTRAATRSVPDIADTRDPFAQVEWRDVRRLLDEELNRLPARWRTPLVLCYLEGLTRDEAAERLRCPLRTLQRLLAEGRERLRVRLVRRGLAPALLASAVLSLDGLRAEVPAVLAARTVSLGRVGAVIPQAVLALAAQTHSFRGLVMKATFCALALAAVSVAIVGERQPVGADPIPAGNVFPPNLVKAPDKKAKPPEDALTKQVNKARYDAINYLKARQNKNGAWEEEPLLTLQKGGMTALTLLALLENGVKADDEMIKNGLSYLRKVEPQHVYTVGLQTQVFCKANQKEDAERIRRNVKWLEEAAIWKGANLEGWSYQNAGGHRADNSNTRYAIAGLFAAHKAGFKASREKFWESVRDFYIRTQTTTGGWSYQNENRNSTGTHTMTQSGVLGLIQAQEAIGKKDKAADQAIDAGFAWIANEFKLTSPQYTLYNLDVMAALGRASNRKDFGTRDKKREWYREGAEWLIKNQKPGGEWQLNDALDRFPVISTSFALRFLASRPE